MHPNPTFRKTPVDDNLALARGEGFGMLCVNGPDGPLMAHIPFLVSPDGAFVDLHLVRSNPIARALPAPAVLAVQGPHGYVSPDWYGVEDQVPTWNYVAVHMRGPAQVLPQDGLLDLLKRQSAHFESLLLPKPVWTVDKMRPETIEKMMRMIVPCRMQIDDIQGTWKLNQNKTDAARLSAAEALAAAGQGATPDRLAQWMRDVLG